MNKVTTIHLHGNAYQLEEDGYHALRHYLDDAAAKLQGNPDREEIIADIEQAMAEKFRGLLGPHKTVVSTREVEGVISELGPVDGGPGVESGSPTGASSADPNRAGQKEGFGATPLGRAPAKRLFKVADGAMLAGVCNGLAAYFAIDPTWVRLGFVFLTIVTKGLAIVVYLALAFILPSAFSPEEKAAARGAAFTAQEFIRRAKAGYYEGMKSFPDRQARRAWKRKFRGEMREWRENFRREMRAGTGPWRHFPASAPWVHRGSTFARSLLGLLLGLLVFGCVAAIISLVTHGGVMMGGLPGIPIWLGVILIILAFKVVAWPIKVARYSLHAEPGWGWGGPGVHPWFFLGDLIVWITVVAAILWVANGHDPRVHQALMDLPPALHRAADEIRAWWDRR
jgi:phage shock protein PspC (stress-responsive transcriptional regulator)